MKSKKIITFENAVSLVAKLKKQNKKVVLCHGVFDLLHIGHIKHFQEAKKFGDVLIVSLTDDKYVNKGSNRPAFNISLREEALAAISKIDYVFKIKCSNRNCRVNLVVHPVVTQCPILPYRYRI